MAHFSIPEEDKHKIIALISALIPEAKIYLFGSRARNTNSEWSDIDIALDAGTRLPKLTVSEIRDIMEATNLPYKVDIVDFHAVYEALQQAILKDRILWKL
jgi:predicted nucleotidyltransferase